MPRPSTAIDRDKLRAALRALGHEYIFYMLDDAIDLLPPAKLYKLATKYINPERLLPDNDNQSETSLIEAVKAFDKASRAGEYYEAFMVNSSNFTEQSAGTTAWIAAYNRLLDRCVAEQKKTGPAEVRESFDILFRMLDYIDECNDDVIFFADEGGAWQVGVDWQHVLPSWFQALSATATPEEYAEQITTLLKHHYTHGRAKMLTVARKAATPEQRKALTGR